MTRPRLEAHPDYPFRAGREERLAAGAADFFNAPAEGAPGRRTLGEFIALAHRFAFLERLIQGEILYTLPVHVRTAAIDPENPREQDGELFAEEESDLLDWSAGPASDLPDALDEIGIKVIFQGKGESPNPGDLYGAFHFLGEVGPALLAGIPAGRPETAFILAHEFGHLVADVNPYHSRFCRWDAATLENRVHSPAEARADRFARALLLPRARVRAALADLGPGPREPGEPDPRAAQLAAFFEVPLALVPRRLWDLQLPPLGHEPVLRSSAGGPAGDGPASLQGDAYVGAGMGAGSGGRADTSGEDDANAGVDSDADAYADEVVKALVDADLDAAVDALADADVDIEADASSSILLSLPERFVNLALAAYSARVAEVEDLARFFSNSEIEVMRMVKWAGVTRLPEEEEE